MAIYSLRIMYPFGQNLTLEINVLSQRLVV